MRYWKYNGSSKINIIKHIRTREDGREVKEMKQYHPGDVIEMDDINGWDPNEFIEVDNNGEPILEEIYKPEKPAKKEDFKWLAKINGIGEKTVDDVERMYKNKTELREALERDKVPLRNDVITKLKSYFRIDELWLSQKKKTKRRMNKKNGKNLESKRNYSEDNRCR